MNLVVLYMLILVTQLSLFTYGKSSPVADLEEILSSQLSNNASDRVEGNVGGISDESINERIYDSLKKCSG